MLSPKLRRILQNVGGAALILAVSGCASQSPPAQNFSADCVVPPENIPSDRREISTTTPIEAFLETSKLESCAASGSPSAQTVLALRLLMGRDVEQDNERGERLLRNAAEVQRHPDAMYNLGAAYAAGMFADPDDEQALYWIEQAAEAGDPNGVYWLGFFYWTGRVVDVDQERALELFEQAAELRHSEAAFMIGQAYHTGEVRQKDYDQAMEWYKKADTWSFNQKAQFNMARLRQQRLEANNTQDIEE